jgi:hypothetical protein
MATKTVCDKCGADGAFYHHLATIDLCHKCSVAFMGAFEVFESEYFKDVPAFSKPTIQASEERACSGSMVGASCWSK